MASARAWPPWGGNGCCRPGGPGAASGCRPEAVSQDQDRLGRLLRRPEFLAVAGTRRRWNAPGLVLQLRRRGGHEVVPAAVRYGLTASRKVGGAVQRNRARRRLRALAEEIFPIHALGGVDLVLIARTETITRPFADLRADLVTALRRLGVWQEAPEPTGAAVLPEPTGLPVSSKDSGA